MVIAGVWLFSIRHRFEHAKWMPDASCSFAAACLGGASYLRLPRFLQWFTGKLVDIDADLLAKTYIEAQDRQIAEISGKPRAPIKSLTRVRRR